VAFLDSTGLSVLVHAYNARNEAGHTLRVAGEQDHVRKIIEVTGLAEILHTDGPTST
jgi:anti-anti-sigma factor